MIMMTRKEGWEERLAVVIEEARRKSWSWGEHDCCAFSRACVSALLDGPTPWDALFGYHDEAEAMAIVGDGKLLALLDEHARRVVLTMARRGDLAVLPSENGPVFLTLGVVEGSHVWCAGLRGVARVKLSAALVAWRVG